MTARKKPAPPARITPEVLRELQSHLRRRLGCMTLSLDPQPQPGATVELRIGREVVGTVDHVDEEGEHSWAVTLVVLEKELTLPVGPGRVILRPLPAAKNK